MIVDKLKQSILNYAISGKLSTQMETDSSVDNMIDKIKIIRNKYIKNKIATDDKYQEISNDMIFNIPSSWRWIRLGEIGNWGSGSTPERGNQTFYKNGTVSWIKTGELNDGYIGESEEKITELALKKCSFKINNPGDILIAMYGATIGKLGIATITTTTNQACCGCSIYGGVVNKYLFYYLLSIRSKLIALGEGSGQPNISRKKIVNLPFPLPPIEEQQRIVDKIEELFAKLDEIKPIEDELEMIKSTFSDQMKKSILNDCFSGTANFINEDYKIWKSDLIINIADICTGNSIPESVKKSKYAAAEIGYNYIATKDLLFNHTFNYNNGIKIPYSEKRFKYASKNDILMCIEGGSAGKKIGILDEKVCYGNKLCKFSIKTDTVIPKFLYYYLQSNVFLKNFYENLNGIIGGVSVNKIKKIKIKYPSIEEQQRIVDKLELLLPLCDEIENLVKENYNG